MNIFRRISHRIALQFTAFVFLLLLINGVVFLAADFGNAHRQSQIRLSQTLRLVAERPWNSMADVVRALPPPVRERVRIVDALGNTLYGGIFFEELPFEPVDGQGFSSQIVGGEHFNILTAPITRSGQLEGYIQVTEIQRFQTEDLPLRALLHVLVSAGISALTYFVGLLFARRSLRPAAETMQRLEQFTQDASHELRTPLAMLSSSLDLALKTKEYEAGIVSAKDDLKRIASLVERLLELARLDTFALERRSIDLSALAADCALRHRPLAEQKKVAIETEIAPGIHVRGDETLLRQAISNLIANAVKFNASGGKVRIVLKKGSLAVHDTGVGIAPEALPHIFDRFYQADASRAGNNGFGLGLALVKRILDLHGWSVIARSTIGKGTVFTILIPS